MNIKIHNVGIINRSADCYINSIIQCLMSLEKFVSYFIKNYEKNKKNTIVLLIYGIIDNFISGKNTIIDCLQFKKYLKKDKRFLAGIQNDSSEFLLFLINDIHDSLLKKKLNYILEADDLNEKQYIYLLDKFEKNKSKLDKKILIEYKLHHYIDFVFYEYKKYKKNLYENYYSPISNIFGLSMYSEVRCFLCNNISVSFYQDFYITLEINTENKNCTLNECLDLYTNTEILDNDNKYKCSMCNDKFTKCSKKIQIFKKPNNLIISLKYYTNKNIKKYINIECPFILDIKKYMNNALVHNNTKYKLCAINCQSGGTESGHYYSYCKNFYNNIWYTCNDSDITINNKLNNIEKNNNTINIPSYILFYDLIE